MTSFSQTELDYLTGEDRLARIATADAQGRPQVTPVGMWSYNQQRDTIDVTGRNFTETKKFRNVADNPHAALVVDDLASYDPWRPRAVMVQGPARALRDGGDGAPVIRIEPETVVSWGLDAD